MSMRFWIISTCVAVSMVCIAFYDWIQRQKELPEAAQIAERHGGRYTIEQNPDSPRYIEALESIFGEFKNRDIVVIIFVNSDSLTDQEIDAILATSELTGICLSGSAITDDYVHDILSRANPKYLHFSSELLTDQTLIEVANKKKLASADTIAFLTSNAITGDTLPASLEMNNVGRLEAVSKPLQNTVHTGEMHEAEEQMGMTFVSHHQTAEVEQPADGPFHFPATTVPAEPAAVLRPRLDAVVAMRTHQPDAARRQSCAQRITVGRPVVDQVVGRSPQHSFVEQSLDQFHFGGRSTGDVSTQGGSMTVHEEHDLGSLAALCFADVGPPFFAGLNVPSANASSQTSSFRRSRCFNSLLQAARKTPDSVHSFNRRQQVLGDGKCVGKSFHRAPVLNTQRIPSRQARVSTRGRPPLRVMGDSGNKSAIRNHCSSDSCDIGSVLDPVMLRPRRERGTRVVVMVRPPFGSLIHAIAVPKRSVDYHF
jgi:hypothetical protein